MVRRKRDPRSFSTRSGIKDTSRIKRTNVLVSKRKRKYKVLREIKNLRKATNLLIPKMPFARLVRAIFFDVFPFWGNIRIQGLAIEALQEAVEMYMVQFFEDATLLTLHAKRVTLSRMDMILLRRLRGRDDIINR